MRPDHPIFSEQAKRLGHTLPGRVAVFAQHWPDRCAIREKWRGLWRETTSRRFPAATAAVFHEKAERIADSTMGAPSRS